MSTPDRAPNICAVDVRTALKEGMARLRAAHVPSHTLATELLLMHALGRDRTWLYTHPEAALDPAVAEKYSGLIARRAAGEPTQYWTAAREVAHCGCGDWLRLPRCRPSLRVTAR